MSARKTPVSWISVALMLFAGADASAQDATAKAAPTAQTPLRPPGVIAELPIVADAWTFVDRSLFTGKGRPDGPYIELGNQVTGAGWIAAGPGYRHHVFNDRAVVDASAALSKNNHEVIQARLEWPSLAHDRIAFATQVMYQDLRDMKFFGVGNDSLRSDRTTYRFNDASVAAYGEYRATTWLSVDGRVGRVDPAQSSPIPPTLVHGDLGVIADFRDAPDHPTRGGLYRAGVARYSDRDAGDASFRRYEIEAAQFIPVSANWLVAVHGWEVFSAPTSGGAVPFYLMPSLGGTNTLRGYDDYRFRDNNMQVFNAEVRCALFAHLDVAGFVDAGKVAARAGGLDFTNLKTSYGAGLRLHSGSATLVRMDIGHSREGWRVFFAMSDPFKRWTSSSGRQSVAPFVS